MKLVESLTADDLAANAVWAFANSDGHGGTMVRPVKAIPVANTAGKIFGTRVSLANGTTAWALLGNVVALSPRETQHLLTVSVERDGRWFHLARYHDFDYADRGPAALARFLGLQLRDVFPLSYDLSSLAIGDVKALAGAILDAPRERLTRSEIIAMAVP